MTRGRVQIQRSPPVQRSSESTALTVYHPLPEARRAEFHSDERIAALVEETAEHLERHFLGTMQKIREIRAFSRGHAMYASTPGSMARSTRVSVPMSPVFFADTDCTYFSTFGDARSQPRFWNTRLAPVDGGIRCRVFTAEFSAASCRELKNESSR